jgi:hypothetical protein
MALLSPLPAVGSPVAPLLEEEGDALLLALPPDIEYPFRSSGAKKRNGRLLEGRTWDGVPEVAAMIGG